jgi:site-specific recombinase XerD
VRLTAALDAFLHWRRIERGATPRSIESYRAILEKLIDHFPSALLGGFEGTGGTELPRQFLERWADRSASTRCNVISVVHSFFTWAVTEELINADPSRRIRRPPQTEAADHPSVG